MNIVKVRVHLLRHPVYIYIYIFFYAASSSGHRPVYWPSSRPRTPHSHVSHATTWALAPDANHVVTHIHSAVVLC